jgi:hypothetical protein
MPLRRCNSTDTLQHRDHVQLYWQCVAILHVSISSSHNYADSCVIYYLCTVSPAVLYTQKLGQRTAKGILRLRMSADVSSLHMHIQYIHTHIHALLCLQYALVH